MMVEAENDKETCSINLNLKSKIKNVEHKIKATIVKLKKINLFFIII